MEVGDFRVALELALAIAGFLGAFILRGIATSLRELEEKIAELPKTYVLKTDYQDDIRYIKDTLREIFNDLKKKQDRRRAS